MKKTKILIYVLMFYIAVTAFSNNGVNYSEIKDKTWEVLKKNYSKPKVSDITKKFEHEKIELQDEKLHYIFPENEIWAYKKFNKETLYKITLIRGFPCIFINDELIFPSVDALTIGANSFVGIVFKDDYGNLMTTTHGYYLELFSNTEKKTKTLIKTTSEDYKTALQRESRLINVINELIYIANWDNESVFGPSEYASLILYKLNLLKGEVEIFDSYEYGIITMGIDIVEGYYPFYDISEDKRFIYIPAWDYSFYTKYDKNNKPTYYKNKFTIGESFKRESVEMHGGLYAYDWWENRLFKLAEGNVVAVTNNTEDGYVYFQVQEWVNGKRSYEYYRMKNPEEMLRNYQCE